MGERVFTVDTTSALMLRRRPDVTSPWLARLMPGQVVARLDEEERDGWFWVFADVPGDGVYVGYVAGWHLALRQEEASAPVIAPAPAAPDAVRVAPAGPASPFVARLIAACEAELAFFNDGRIKEAVEPARSRIGEYWKELGERTRDGASDVAWSAAFISFVMRHAGAGTLFKYSGAHRTYINEALRQKDNPDAPFQAMRPEDYAPRLGDLIANARPTQDNPAIATFETARNIRGYFSHADIVTAITDQNLSIIGGNVGNSVTRQRVPLTAEGLIAPSFVRPKRVFAILRNNVLDPV